MTRAASGTNTVAIVVVAIAVVTYLLMNHLLMEEVLGKLSTRGIFKSVVYLAWITGAFAVFAAVLLTARPLGVAILLLLTTVSVATNYVYAVVVKQEITPDYMEWMVHEVHQLPAAWSEFRPEILIAVAQTVALMLIFVGLRVAAGRFALISPSFLGSSARNIATAAFLVVHAVGMLLQPSYDVAETNLFVFGVPAAFSSSPQRREVGVRPSAVPLAEKIVLVIDESVGARIYADHVAPVVRGLPAVDFGEGASVAACSAASNALLRWGVDRSRVETASYDPRTNPTIWAYARAAGFTTALIDAQSRGAKQNYVGSGELALVDEFIPADVGIDSDHRVALLLAERLRRPGRELIYIVKRGNHFPYDTKYPVGTLPTDASKPAKYAAAVAYTTRKFFELLAPRLLLSNVLIVYTSDHGQNLASRAAHCSGQHHPDEYAVPIVAVTGAATLGETLAAGLPGMRDRASHVNIFPTLLFALGYDRDWIEGTYGPTLAGPPDRYVWVDGWLPHPTRRKTSVAFRNTATFPGRGESAATAP